MSLILNDLTPWHWAASGAVIAFVTLALLYVGNRRTLRLPPTARSTR